ncbi:MAG: High affinity Ca2+/Mn2+ P-type ATPase-like protein [Peltula sp. TS41687]|nr:MAG: High affinity Ca2+/Mn2+ P-type ATPase-like protein [Peltula sp. TS41687]
MSGTASPAIPLRNLPSAHPLYPSQGDEENPLSTKSSSRTSSYSLLSPNQVARQLSTSLVSGLSSADARNRLANHGPNELPHEEPEPLWLRFVKQFKETLILLLLASAAISAFLGNWDDAISITIAVIIVVSVAFVQEYRSEKSLEALNRLVPHHAHLIRNGHSSDGFSETRDHANLPEHDLAGEKREEQHVMASAKGSSTVLASQLVPGDLVLFSTGDRIPADIRITRAADLSIDESNLTGENEPVRKEAGALKKTRMETTLQNGHLQQGPRSSPFYASPAAGTVGADLRLNEQTNIAFMGTLVRSGHGQGIVIATGSDTEFGAISASLNEIESPRTPLQLSMDRLGQELSYMSFAVIFLIVIVGLWQGRKLLDMFTIGVSLAVAAIPEGLPIIVTVTLALGVLRMARRGAIVRRLPSVETLGSVNVVCSDKTGTLTTNHMTVTKIWHFDLSSPLEVTKDLLSSAPGPLVRKIVRIGNIANHARLSSPHTNSSASAAVLSSTMSNEFGRKSRWVGQPTDVALLDLVDEFGEEDLRDSIGARITETPFSSERKWMGVVVGGGVSGKESGATSGSPPNETAYIKGALEQVLSRCDTYLTKDGREVVLDEPRRKMALDASEAMAKEGLRVLGLASGSLTSSSSSSSSRPSMNGALSSSTRSPAPKENEDRYLGLTFTGLVGMNDPPRKDVQKSIRRLMAGGVKVIMITGDSEATAVAIAKRIGMPLNESAIERSVLRGHELDLMTERELAQAMSSTSIFARTSPDHKMKIIRALQSRGDVVAMTGDGVNDAPALKKADIGVAMGLLGTDVAKEAADMILTDDDFSTILGAIEEGKGIFYNIQNFLTFQLSTSVAALSLVLLSTIFGLKNPLNAMQILWINILMDGPPAQSLGVEPVDPAVMTRPPRSRSARVLTRPVLYRILLSSSTILLGTLITYMRCLSSSAYTVTSRDTTMTFTVFVFFDMFNALTCRSESKSVLRGQVGLFSNRMFNYAVAGSLAGQMAVINVPQLQKVFQTEALGVRDLLGLVALASAVFWVDEGRKYVRWRRGGKGRGLGGYSSSV